MSETEDQAREFIGRVDARLVLAHQFNIEKFSETLFELVDEIATRDNRIAKLERENAELRAQWERLTETLPIITAAQWERLTSDAARGEG